MAVWFFPGGFGIGTSGLDRLAARLGPSGDNPSSRSLQFKTLLVEISVDQREIREQVVSELWIRSANTFNLRAGSF